MIRRGAPGCAGGAEADGLGAEMAQLSANREPTMEEILASIRRIIESNDTGSDAASPAIDQPGIDIESEVEELAVSTAPPVRTESVDERPRAALSSAPVVRPQAAGRPVSLAEVAARVRASGMASLVPSATAQPVLHSRGNAALRAEPETERDDEPELHVSELPAVFVGQDDDEAEVEEETFEAANDRTARGPDAVRPPDPVFDADIRDAVAASMKTEASAARAADTEMPTEAKPPVAESGTAECAGPAEQGLQLLSATAGAKVAAAFEDLTDAFQAPRRSFDEIATEMLRPMLQEWLDDNLPTLVEKLVREEIERVARGNRR